MIKDSTIKNIWIFHHYATPPSMNGLLRPYYFADNLKELGNDVTIFAASYLHFSDINIIKNNELYIENKETEVPFVFINTPSSKKGTFKRIVNMITYYTNLLKTINKMSDRAKPDVIYASSPHPLALIAGLKVARKYHIQCICEVRDLWPESFVAYGIVKKRNPLLKLLYLGERWIYKRADKIIFTVDGGKDYIVEKKWDVENGGPIDLKKIYSINNGVDLENFQLNRTEFRLPDEDLDNRDIFKVVYTGTIRKANNIESLYQVAKLLKERNIHNVKILVWGDGDCRPELMKKVNDEGLSNIVFKGRAEKKYMPGILDRADVLFLEGTTSELFRFGISPNKLFDYLAAGKPILSVIAAKYDIIQSIKCGIVTTDNPSNIYNAIIEFTKMPRSSYDEMCQRSRETSLEYDYKNLTKKLLSIINL